MSSAIVKELPELVSKKIITEEVAQNIRNYYQKNQNENPNKLFIIFGILGALLGGLGVILILAHNWDDFSVFVKTVFSLLPLLVGQLFCVFTLLKKYESKVWRESSATFLFFAIAASISLIAQVYNLPENFNSFLLTWMLLALPLVYIMKSSFVSLLYILGITWYGTKTNYFNYPHTNNYNYWGLLFLILPYYFNLIQNNVKSNFTNFHHWFIGLSVAICFGTFSNKENTLLVIGYSSLLTIYYLISKTKYFEDLKQFKNAYHIISKVGLLYILFFLSFKLYWDQIANKIQFLAFDSHVYMLLLFTAFVFWFIYSKKTTIQFQNPIVYAFILITLLYVLNKFISSNIIVSIANLFLLLVGVYEINDGAKTNSLFKMNFGLIIISILIACRFFDTEMSFIVRGILFLVIGSGFFALNYYLLKKRNHNAK